jgi:phage tail sheath protein FI
MRDYKTPGVYVEELSVLPGSVAGVSTAVPAFIGYTQQAGATGELYYKPTRITTLKEYESLFGFGKAETIAVDTAQVPVSVTVTAPNRFMYYSMQMFFYNGGEACYIVALDDTDSVTETNRFTNAINALELEDEPTLIVLVDGVNMSSTNYYSKCQDVLRQCDKLKDRFAIFDVIQSDSTTADAAAFRAGVVSEYLSYGAAYYPYLQTALNYQYDDSTVTVTYYTGEKNADGSLKIDTETDKPVTATKGLNEIAKGTELYNTVVQEIKKYYVTLPPSSAVAGAFASVDRDRGVWKAPANVGLAYVTGPAKKLTEDENDGLNVDPQSGKSINAIRAFTGKGTLIWGSRTLAGNSNEWRYVPVRRLFNYIEESVKKATSFAVFEPNNAMTWLKLRSMVESFLDNLWRQGALAGGKSEDAYFVQVGLGTTMTSQDILDGKLIIKIGIAAVRPAEFIILEFTHKLQRS